MGKPTVHDMAREAGGSLAMVDRVLNSRPDACEAVKRRGYVRDIAANLARQRTYRFAFLLPEGNRQFLAALEDGTIDVVTAQNVGHIVRSAIRVLRAKTDELEIIESQRNFRIDIAIREN